MYTKLMDTDREKIIEKSLKLRELANRGIGGEKSNAIAMLKLFKEKHEITDAEMGSFISIESDWYQNKSTEEKNTPFARWFKQSCTVDEKTDKPLIFFHKSRTETMFYEFRHDMGVKHAASNYGFSFVHEDDTRYIRHIGHGVEFRCYLKMINPYYIYSRLDGNCYGQNGELHKPIYINQELCNKLSNQGFDSIVVQSETHLNCYIVFNSNQIKSINNVGSYDSNTNNIFG